MKKIYSLFAAVVLAATFNAQTTVNYVWANQGFANAALITTGNLDANLSYVAAQNSSTTAPAYYNSGTNFRMYSDAAGGDGNSFTITPSAGNTITSLTINAVATYTPPVQYRINGGAYQAATLSGNTYTISGITAGTSITFRNNVIGANTQLRITSLGVTYTSGTLAVADFGKAKSDFVKNTFVKSNEITFGAQAKDVKVYNMFGQVVKTASVKENESLSVSELQKGNYIVTGTVNNQPVSQKILKD
ncbi:hypothetical protein ASG22_07570 [Chryseobacterium sp. Leaf405]|uniref:T9SS type A sorting domain-containing protein n=1 Tax=Chryseobacterium sp. Leaf405 TaxID=1736367 RepID=UPI0006FA1B5F|nr:T9SS type A sorting domain-containing protein [Chryseobacterium sp. Leaf405]KQT23876.1 hypothetical protein ASG22_07570 [Chryseobacterium sp. Leaf405]